VENKKKDLQEGEMVILIHPIIHHSIRNFPFFRFSFKNTSVLNFDACA